MNVLRVLAPAKVNLFLGIGSVRPDGYHQLTSVFHALGLADEIEIRPAERLTVTTDPDLGIPEQLNLAYRAAVDMGSAFGRDPLVAIHVVKRIPHGAGLGGGSSDAAGVIAGLACLWGIDLADDQCLSVARCLGADVPFFLTGGAALMTGRGDVLERALPPLPGVPVALVRPPLPVSTAQAYRTFDLDPVAAGDHRAVVDALERSDSSALARSLANNLESAAATVVPEVAEAVAWVRSRPGVMGALVAGSGSAVFALCEDPVVSRRVAEEACGQGWWSTATELARHGVSVREGGCS